MVLVLRFWVSHYLYGIFTDTHVVLKISPKGADINSPGRQPGVYAIQYNISTKGA